MPLKNHTRGVFLSQIDTNCTSSSHFDSACTHFSRRYNPQPNTRTHEMTLPRFKPRTAAMLLLPFLVGCGTTRMTDTPRAATEMLLVSQAADKAVAQIDFSPLTGKTVFLDGSSIPEKDLDKGYLMSLVRQQLLATGAMLYDEKARAEYIVDLRSGGLGTDRQSVLLGTPAVQLPGVVPGMPTSVPEIALMKKNDQRGVAKIGVFAYNRITGRALWQSGTVEAESRVKDTWVFGAGPFSRGSIRKQTELAGEPLPTFPTTIFGANAQTAATNPLGEQYFPNQNPPPPQVLIPAGLMGLTGAAPLVHKPVIR